MSQEVSRQELISLLAEVSDLSIQARKTLSQGLEEYQANQNDELILTREELERLMETQENLNIYAFHSSGVKAIGDHSSS
ncbi:MAG: hypothetical protein AAGG56_03835 [Pseudomonadota bacterium]